MNRLIRNAIWKWHLWRIERRLIKTMPQAIEDRKEYAALRMRHKSTKVVVRRQREAMLSALRRGA
jgi:hypothetical protein